MVLKRQKRERNWSQRHKGTHFFHRLMGFEEMTFPQNPITYTRVQRYRNKVSSSRVVLFTFAFGTEEELLLVSEKSSSSFSFFSFVESRRHFCQLWGVLILRTKKDFVYSLCSLVGVRANSLSLSLSLSLSSNTRTHTKKREKE